MNGFKSRAYWSIELFVCALEYKLVGSLVVLGQGSWGISFMRHIKFISNLYSCVRYMPRAVNAGPRIFIQSGKGNKNRLLNINHGRVAVRKSKHHILEQSRRPDSAVSKRRKNSHLLIYKIFYLLFFMDTRRCSSSTAGNIII